MTVLQNRKPDGTKGDRKEDKAFWAYFDYFTTKYKLPLWLLVWFIVALGFSFKTPAQIVHELQTQIDELKIAKKTLEDKVDILLRLSCFNEKTTEQQKRLSGLNCNFK